MNVKPPLQTAWAWKDVGGGCQRHCTVRLQSQFITRFGFYKMLDSFSHKLSQEVKNVRS